VSAGVAPLRRLSVEQYRNTVRDLLGIDVPALALPGDEVVDDRFFSNASTPLQSVDLDRYQDAAELLARSAVANLGALVSCDPATGSACARTFIERFGRRAYRRPLSGEEVARLETVFTAAGGSFADGIEAVVAALLQSPKFLYLVEPVPASAAGKVVPVDPWALASRLSYFLLGTLPDDTLLDAAGHGELASPAGVAQQAARLSRDPRFGANVASFHDQWLLLREVGGADKDPQLFPAWSPELKAALAEESRRFVEHVMAAEEGRIETLLAAPFSILGGPLYDFYGVAKPAGAPADRWQKTALDPGQRAGIATQGSLLAAQAHANQTSYILRGKLVRESLFCTPIPPPPPEAANVDSSLPPTASARERSLAHRVMPACATCHELFDPIGFAFENYDAIGRYRAQEAGGQPIDTAIQVTGTRELDGPVASAVELLHKIATAGEVRDCIARQWMRFALGRLESDDDAASLAEARRALRDSGRIPDLVAALARSDSFRYQRVSP
jgi:hypothetical protein